MGFGFERPPRFTSTFEFLLLLVSIVANLEKNPNVNVNLG
jgi:hypothetical protein